MTLAVAPIRQEEYLRFIAERPVSYRQCPSWASVKEGWGSEHLGWRDASGTVVGVGLVLYRNLPVLRRPLAYLVEGPVVDWGRRPPQAWLAPLVEHLRRRKAVVVRVGPALALHRWHAATVKDEIGAGRRLEDLPPDVTDPVATRIVEELTAGGWSRARGGPYGSARHTFEVPLTGRTPEQLLAAMNQQWRRAIRKAEKAGVVVEMGGPGDLADFHRVYSVTAARDGFVGHPLEYFQRAWAALSTEGEQRIRLYLGRHEGEVLAGMLVVTVGGLAGYTYGGSVSHKREVYPSNAVHWRIMRDLLAEGADVYDMRGVDDTLDPDQPRFGILRFKLGTGGDAIENIGDWELPLQPVLHRAATAAIGLYGLVPAARSACGSLRSRLPRWGAHRRSVGASIAP
jgi:lipid II:glycine glycyltransferase (peptidoglycan interpeptide bridge formation enzyme)